MNACRPTPAAVALATLVEIYGDRRHLPEMTVPFERFDSPPQKGERVEIIDSTGDRATGVVVKLSAVIQPDFDTYDAAALRGQEGLPIP